jgi:hypothetical protein
MKLEQEIINLKPREESGSKTARKYTFQKDLSLYLLLTVHEKSDDYVFLFDFHDDLVVLDSETNPNKIDFYQIKSKDSGNWTVKALTKKEKDKLSITGKLYLNKINFTKNTNSLNFISNASFSFKQLINGEESLKKSKIRAKELEKSIFKEFEDSIKSEHTITTNTLFGELTSFHVTKLSNKDSSTHCLGELSKLINKINPENSINPELAYKQVFNEVSRQTENTFGDKSISNLDELINIKGISKRQFVEFLEKAGLYKSVEQEWDEIKASLESCGIGHIELIKYKKYWRDITATLIKDTNKIPLEKLIKDIESVYDYELSIGAIDDSSNLLTIINHCFSKVSSDIYDDYFIKCLVIKIINEK